MLSLSAEQWQKMGEFEAINFANAVTQQFLADRPEMAQQPGAQVVLERLCAAHAYAVQLGFTSTPDIVSFMYWAADQPGFYLDPAIDRQLRKPGYTPEQRFADLIAVAKARLKGSI